MTRSRTAVTALLLWCAFTRLGSSQTAVDLRTQSKSVDFSGAISTKPMQTGSSLPATCAVGQFYFLTGAPAGNNIYACNPANNWLLEGNSLVVNQTTANEVLSSNGTGTEWVPLGGDVSGAPGTVTVGGLQGHSVSNAVPAGGQVLQWNATANQWQPAVGWAGNASYVFTSQTSITIPGTVHQFNTANLIVNCYDNSTPPQAVEPDKIQISPTTYNVTINFSTAQSGYCVVNGAGTAASGGGGGGSVASVFGRTGAVMGQTGDYNFGQIAGTIGSAQLPAPGGDVGGTYAATTVTGLQGRLVSTTAPSSGQALVWNATASAWQPGTVATGGVSSIFGRTGVVTAQIGDYSFGQIAGTIGSSQFPNAGGDISGNLTAATVTGIQNRAVSSVAPLSGQALVWNSTSSTWAPGTVSGSGGATMAYQLGDLAVGRTSSTVLTVGAGCTSTAPCNVRFGYQVFTISTSATATISGSTSGTAYVYINGSGTLMVGHNLTVACSAGCTAQSGVTSFPANVIPIATWTATSGTWDSTGGRDQRAFLAAKVLAGGQGIVITEAAGQSTLAVDNGVIPTYLMNTATLDFPSMATGACAADQTIAVTGANPGDAVAPGWPALPSGVIGIMMVSATNTVTVRLCNMSGLAVDPASASYRATIVRNY